MRSYENAVRYVAGLELPWEKLKNKTVMISGASGLIGTFLIDTLFKINDIHVIAIGRDIKKARERFADYWDNSRFTFLNQDINERLDVIEKADYVIHAASNTHPISYASDPVGTIMTNIIGTKNMLDYARYSGSTRTLFLSSVEIYGENKGDVEAFTEDYLGYIDCNTLRAGYPESKRAGEALCQAYRKQYGLDVTIVRLSRTYGPTMLSSDTKAIAQFMKKGINGEDIVLKSAGNQCYSYSYVADAVSAIVTILLNGTDGEAYNVADINSNISLKELAELIAEYSRKNVIYENPTEEESIGYSKATKALLDSSKLKNLGWNAHWPIKIGVKETMDCFIEEKNKFKYGTI